MTEKKTVKKPKRNLSKAAKIIIIDLCIIGIPLIIYLGILISAQLQTGNPIFGDRFNGDLNPAITKENISKLESEIAKLSGVEKVDIQLTTAQFRINVDAEDSADYAKLESLADGVYTRVNQELPITTYFTSNDGKKMYDLAINAYNFVDGENEEMKYVLLTKNANMSSPIKQTVSEPKDAELASELRGENETPETTETPEVAE